MTLFKFSYIHIYIFNNVKISEIINLHFCDFPNNICQLKNLNYL